MIDALSATPDARRGAYAKSARTRQAIIEAAFPIFAERGLDAVGTREIAQAAGVNQPAINYHFGSKEGLYRACAGTVAEHFAARMGPASEAIAAALAQGPSRETAAAKLKNLVHELVDFLVIEEQSAVWSAFMAREMRADTEAAQIMHRQVWEPGTRIIARLIEAAWGKPEPDEAANIEALLLISSLVIFTSGREVSLKVLGWSELSTGHLETFKRILDQRIDEILARGR